MMLVNVSSTQPCAVRYTSYLIKQVNILMRNIKIFKDMAELGDDVYLTAHGC